jgi:hypothetical protein
MPKFILYSFLCSVSFMMFSYFSFASFVTGYVCTDIVGGSTVKPVLNGISRVQNICLLKPGFRLIKVYYDSHGT